MQGHRLPGGADDVDHKIPHEAVLHTHTDPQEVVHIGQGLSRRELGEGDLRLETRSHIIRKEDPTSKVAAWKFVPGGGVHHASQTKGLSNTTHQVATGAVEVGLSAHAYRQVDPIGACAAVVVHHVELGDELTRLGVGVRYVCCGVG